MATIREMAIQIAASIAKPYEGLFLAPYLCPAGVPTIGYGSTYYQDGTKVTLKDPPITKDQAETLLIYELEHTFLPSVIKLCPPLLNDSNKLGALVDFTYNLGAGNLKVSTLRKRINSGDWDGAKREIVKWNKAGGKELAGLTRRRITERQYI